MRTVLVTGGNRGIGLELCRQLAERGYPVVAAVRHSSAELETLGVEVITDVDVTQTQGLERLDAGLGERDLSLLINNAGIMHHTSLRQLDLAAVREEFEVNAVGPLRVTVAMLPRLERGAKVALVTSRMGSIADNTSGGSYGYRMSKAALNAAGKSLALDLASAGVAVALLHPGWVKTDMTDNSGNVSAAEAASSLLQRIDNLSLENSGTFWHANGEILPW